MTLKIHSVSYRSGNPKCCIFRLVLLHYLSYYLIFETSFQEYIRRQRKNVWLETHIWHAKRFRMIEKYGYKLAVQSFQRSFRPSYRDSVRHCAVQDISFLNCFQVCKSGFLKSFQLLFFKITVEDRQWLISTLSVLFPPSASPTLAYKTSLNGTFEISSLLYEPGEYPRGFIGPVRFMWCKKKYLFSNVLLSPLFHSAYSLANFLILN